MNCFWKHDWTKWHIIQVKLTNGSLVDFQKRECTICGYVERQVL